MAIALVLMLLLVGTVLFHFLSPWNLTPLASNWGAIDNTILITFWVTGFVFVVVNLFLVYAIIRYRYNAARRSSYEPENKSLELWLTGITTVGIAALLAPGLVVWGSFVTVPDDAHEFEVIGQQWHWSFRFPGEDGEFGAVDPRLITEDNPFGLDPDDPNSLDDVLVQSPVVLLPIDRPVKVLMRSTDVIHNFKVANFRAKMDLLAGQVTYMWLTPTREGEYDVICAQLCGVGHFAMRGRVEIVQQEVFDEWFARQPTFGELQARAAPDPVAGEQLYATCIACHGSGGEGNRDLNSPAIAGMDAWSVARQLKNFRSGARGTHSEDIYGQQMRPFATLLADEDAIRNVAAYIETLSPVRIEPTVAGDARRGERLYRTCANCHGRDGQGIRAVNGPALAGVDDWYHVTQLANFREGVRGRHHEDMYGNQMVDMAQMLVSERDVRDVVAYINTLAAPGRTMATAQLGAQGDD
ncbi:MAG: c-type cytochrome [Gammaproteobacteria bacterium]|nr:c-type cytochrome [Gammaproteobacteria bacterium]